MAKRLQLQHLNRRCIYVSCIGLLLAPLCVIAQQSTETLPTEPANSIASLITEHAATPEEARPADAPLSSDAAATALPEDPQWGKSPPSDGQMTVLHGLDKITARVFALEVKHNQPIQFGTLRVTVRGCKRTPPEDPPESAAFLEIVEEMKEEAPKTLFSGWMFASRPSVSALEHPVYDVWVTECIPAQRKPG